jgi:hypothetical protein
MASTMLMKWWGEMQELQVQTGKEIQFYITFFRKLFPDLTIRAMHLFEESCK